MIDEYLAVRVIGGDWPDGLADDELALPATRHWRLLQRVHTPGTGQLSQLLAELRQHLQKPDTVFTLYTVVQVWGRKP